MRLFRATRNPADGHSTAHQDHGRRLISGAGLASGLPSEQALIDATRVVIHTQEQAGIDLVCDGELSRFDINHPETNGMIEYFVRPMAGMRTAITFDELVAYRSQRGMGFRTRPPAVVESAGGRGKGGDECLLWHRRRCLCASHGALSNLQEVSVRTAEYCLGSPYAYGAPSAPTIAAENRIPRSSSCRWRVAP